MSEEKDEIVDLRRRLQEKEYTLQHFTDDWNRMKRESADHAHEKINLESKIKSLESRLKQSESELEAVVKERDLYNEKYLELEKELSDFKKFHDEEFFGWEKLTSNLKAKLSQAEATERELRENWLEDMQEWSVEKANLMDVAGKMAGAINMLVRQIEAEGGKGYSVHGLSDNAKLALAEWDGIKKEGGK